MAWEKKCDTQQPQKAGQVLFILDEKPSFILALGKNCCLMVYAYTNETFVVLYPYYKQKSKPLKLHKEILMQRTGTMRQHLNLWFDLVLVEYCIGAS